MERHTLKSLRISRRVRQKDVEAITKGTYNYIPQSSLACWETGVNVPNANKLLILAKIYKVSYQQILDAWENTITFSFEDDEIDEIEDDEQ